MLDAHEREKENERKPTLEEQIADTRKALDTHLVYIKALIERVDALAAAERDLRARVEQIEAAFEICRVADTSKGA